MKEYFPQVPHQYCTWHFVAHLWDHLETFDTQIYSILKSGIIKLYIHARSTTATTRFEGYGKLSVREVFIEIDKDLQRLLRYRSKKFQFLRGLALFRSLKRFVKDMSAGAMQLFPESRFEKIFLRTLNTLQTLLQGVQERFFETLFMYDTFKVIYSLLYIPILECADRQQQLDNIFGKCWAVARIKAPSMELESLRMFMPTASSTCSVVLGEWVRLWNSYLPGLFHYYDFPITRRTNIAQEQAFSVEKTDLNRRMANSKVGYMLELQGEFYLRFSHCDQEEMRNNFVEEYMTIEIRTLRAAYHQKVEQVTLNWLYRAEPLKGIDLFVKQYGISNLTEKKSIEMQKGKQSYREAIQKKIKLKKKEAKPPSK